MQARGIALPLLHDSTNISVFRVGATMPSYKSALKSLDLANDLKVVPADVVKSMMLEDGWPVAYCPAIA